jgi:hypothetical protein
MSDSRANDPMIGRSIAHYTIEGRLGEGGMGTVYLAHDSRLVRQVAIKVISSVAASDPALVGRLLREARAASALNHPNIVTIHEIGKADGLDFIVMERVEGTPLSRLIPPGGLPVAQVLELGGQIAAAVAAAHGAHIVHRDLKPANVMVTPNGRVKVLDFGLARSAPPAVHDEALPTMAAPTRLTGSGTILGSVGYMSPEQIEGRLALESSDVFSLGIMLFEMLTGRRPFIGDSDWSIMAATVQGAARPVDSLRPEARGELSRIVARCLARRPEDRYPSAAGLAEDLQKLAAKSSTASQGKRRVSRAVMVASALAIVGLAVAAWLLVQESRLRWARGAAIAEIGRLASSGDLVGAYVVARRALEIAPHDFQVEQAWKHLVASGARIESDPQGAEVAIGSYVGGAERWVPLGKTPLTDTSVPFGLLRWRLTRSGYDTLEVGQGFNDLELRLVPSGTGPPGMVLVPSGSVLLESTGKEVELPEFWLDRCEVTNRQYKAFVEADGYRKREHWKEPFIRDGKAIPWEQAMMHFRDATGRAGPATWEFGTYPAGQDDYPVCGVSWYEAAAAYAAFAGRQLPTVYHWYRASGGQGIFSEIIVTSNFSAKGPASVRRRAGLGPFGTYDMAGNAKEWCWNATGGRRFTLGGGWNELVYAFHDEDAQSPFERQTAFGLRCMLQREPLAAQLTAPLRTFQRDPGQIKAVGDDVFHAYLRLYDYDPAPLDARTESVNDVNPLWREELVTVRAAYGSERLPLRIYVPKSGPPPHHGRALSGEQRNEGHFEPESRPANGRLPHSSGPRARLPDLPGDVRAPNSRRQRNEPDSRHHDSAGQGHPSDDRLPGNATRHRQQSDRVLRDQLG